MKHKVIFKDGKILRDCIVSPSPWLRGFVDVYPDEGEAGTFNTSEISAIYPEPRDNEEPGESAQRLLPDVWTY